MRKFFNGLILGIIIGALGYWYFERKAQEHPEAEQHFKQSADQTGSNAVATAESATDALKSKLDTLDLHTDEIRDELEHTGEVIRHKAHDIGAEEVNAASDAHAVMEIKAKYAVDPNLSVWKISVSCSQGHVTLSGTVSAPEDIGRAVTLALDADGVRDVTSTIQVKPST
ncbi:MAG TPA: BON domain-containing protein [Verrucomicrobiae bacterium]|jgi:hypothetical protein